MLSYKLKSGEFETVRGFFDGREDDYDAGQAVNLTEFPKVNIPVKAEEATTAAEGAGAAPAAEAAPSESASAIEAEVSLPDQLRADFRARVDAALHSVVSGFEGKIHNVLDRARQAVLALLDAAAVEFILDYADASEIAGQMDIPLVKNGAAEQYQELRLIRDAISIQALDGFGAEVFTRIQREIEALNQEEPRLRKAWAAAMADYDAYCREHPVGGRKMNHVDAQKQQLKAVVDALQSADDKGQLRGSLPEAQEKLKKKNALGKSLERLEFKKFAVVFVQEFSRRLREEIAGLDKAVKQISGDLPQKTERLRVARGEREKLKQRHSGLDNEIRTLTGQIPQTERELADKKASREEKQAFAGVLERWLSGAEAETGEQTQVADFIMAAYQREVSRFLKERKGQLGNGEFSFDANAELREILSDRVALRKIEEAVVRSPGFRAWMRQHPWASGGALLAALAAAGAGAFAISSSSDSSDDMIEVGATFSDESRVQLAMANNPTIKEYKARLGEVFRGNSLIVNVVVKNVRGKKMIQTTVDEHSALQGLGFVKKVLLFFNTKKTGASENMPVGILGGKSSPNPASQTTAVFSIEQFRQFFSIGLTVEIVFNDPVDLGSGMPKINVIEIQEGSGLTLRLSEEASRLLAGQEEKSSGDSGDGGEPSFGDLIAKGKLTVEGVHGRHDFSELPPPKRAMMEGVERTLEADPLRLRFSLAQETHPENTEDVVVVLEPHTVLPADVTSVAFTFVVPDRSGIELENPNLGIVDLSGGPEGLSEGALLAVRKADIVRRVLESGGTIAAVVYFKPNAGSRRQPIIMTDVVVGSSPTLSDEWGIGSWKNVRPVDPVEVK